MMQIKSAVGGLLLRAIFVAFAIGAAQAQDTDPNPAARAQQSVEPSGKAALKSEAAEAWDAVKDTTNPSLLDAFIKRYGNTFFAEIAKARLDELKATAAKTSPPKTSPSARPAQTDQIRPEPELPLDVAHERVVLYDEDPSNPTGQQYVGSVAWRTEPIKVDGKPDELTARADVEIPSRDFRMALSVRRNLDPTLPASHVLELTFKMRADRGGIANVPGILMKSNEQARGSPLAALAVKVTDGFFLVGLSNDAKDREHNLRLLLERAWVDIAIVYANQRRAILAIDKGQTGARVFKVLFTAWEQHPAPTQPAAALPEGDGGNADRR